MIFLLYLSIPIGIDPVETNEALESKFGRLFLGLGYRGLVLYLFGAAGRWARRWTKLAETVSQDSTLESQPGEKQSWREMRSPVSERSLIIESSDDEDTHSGAATATNGRRRVVHDEEEKGSGSDSDSSSSSSSCATPRRGPCSSSPYAQQWPQSYRSCDSSLLSFLRFLENLQLAIYWSTMLVPYYLSSYYPCLIANPTGSVVLLHLLLHTQVQFRSSSCTRII
jgi:hypothetical protein